MNARFSLLACLAMLVLFAAPTAGQQTPEELLQSALYKQQVEGDLVGAVEILQTLIDDFAEHREIAASALVLLGRVHETLGSANAERAYYRVLNDYPDQRGAVAQARARLALLTPASPAAAEDQGLIARRVCSGFDLRDPSDGYGWKVCGGTWEQISPNGRYVAFTDWGGIEGSGLPGGAGLAVQDLRTGEYRSVTDHTGEEYVDWILWSRDEQRLVYSIYEGDYSHVDLHIVDLDGTDHRLLVDDLPSFEGPGSEVIPHAWSAKGDFIVASLGDQDDVSTIALVSVDDGSITPLKTLPGQAEVKSLSLSPDDRYMVYEYPQASGDEHDLFVLALDGSRDGSIASNVAHDSRPFWTPDGGHIVFLSDRSGRTDLWAMEVDDGLPAGEPEVVWRDVGEIEPLGFTKDGALVYRLLLVESDVLVAEFDWERGRFVGDATRLSERFIGTNKQPSWSPDGSRIAYVSLRAGPGSQGTRFLVVKSLEDGAEKDIELRFRLNSSSRPEWSTDGRQILMTGRYSDETGPAPVNPVQATWRIDIETGGIEREPFRQDWDFTERQREGLRSLGIRLTGRRDLGAYRSGPESLRPGEKLLQLLDGRIRWIRSFDSPSDSTGADSVVVGPVRSWQLSPNGTTLAFTAGLPGGKPDLYVSPLAELEMGLMWTQGEGYLGPQPVRVWELGEDWTKPGPLRWMPDGRHLVFGVRRLGPDGEEQKFVRLDLAGGEPQVADFPISPGQLGNGTFSPDGLRIAFDIAKRVNEVWTLSGFPWDREVGR